MYLSGKVKAKSLRNTVITLVLAQLLAPLLELKTKMAVNAILVLLEMVCIVYCIHEIKRNGIVCVGLGCRPREVILDWAGLKATGISPRGCRTSHLIDQNLDPRIIFLAQLGIKGQKAAEMCNISDTDHRHYPKKSHL